MKTYHTAKGTAKSKTSTETGAEPVTVKNYHTARDTASEVKDLPRERGGASDHVYHVSAQQSLHLAEDQLVPETVPPDDAPARTENTSSSSP